MIGVDFLPFVLGLRGSTPKESVNLPITVFFDVSQAPLALRQTLFAFARAVFEIFDGLFHAEGHITEAFEVLR